MRKFLIAAVAGLLIFGGQSDVKAAPVDDLNIAGVETQDMSGWTRLRDKILGRDKNDRRDRYRDRDRDRYRDRHEDYRDRDRHRHYPPPPPHRR